MGSENYSPFFFSSVILSSHPNTHQCKRTFDLKRETWADERVSALHSTELQQAAPGDTCAHCAHARFAMLCGAEKRQWCRAVLPTEPLLTTRIMSSTSSSIISLSPRRRFAGSYQRGGGGENEKNCLYYKIFSFILIIRHHINNGFFFSSACVYLIHGRIAASSKRRPR